MEHIRKVMDEEKAAEELLEEVQDRKHQLEDEVRKEVDDYIFSWSRKREHEGP